MRSACLLVFAVTLLGSVGCGDPKPPPPLTDEVKEEIKKWDEQVYNEEGGKPQQLKKKTGKK